ncbi:MAG TPA: TlpA disulfide reductase family protein [Terriglobales bacterium]|nr:TlpA disulfide reductase family protein [Terriglobales bacterium]
MTNILAGSKAPDFALKSLDGKPYSLKSVLQKGPAVVAFFKISCPVCQFTFPFLERLFQRYGNEGVIFLGVSQNDARDTRDFVKEYGVTFPVLLDEKGYPASNAYGLTNVPTVFLVDTDGSVKVSSMGFVKADLESIANILADRRKIARAPLFLSTESVPANRPG